MVKYLLMVDLESMFLMKYIFVSKSKNKISFYKNELWLLIKSPLIFLYLPKADVINPRIPDMTGVYGWIIGKIFRKPMFVSLQSDITLLLESAEGTRQKGIVKQGLNFI